MGLQWPQRENQSETLLCPGRIPTESHLQTVLQCSHDVPSCTVQWDFCFLFIPQYQCGEWLQRGLKGMGTTQHLLQEPALPFSQDCSRAKCDLHSYSASWRKHKDRSSKPTCQDLNIGKYQFLWVPTSDGWKEARSIGTFSSLGGEDQEKSSKAPSRCQKSWPKKETHISRPIGWPLC